jgi:endonuclease I
MKKLIAVVLLFHFVVLAEGQGTETFTNIPAASSSYSSFSWTGDNGLIWNAVDTRTDQVITGKAATIRNGLVSCSGIINGIGSLSFKHQQFFSGSAGALEVRINGNLIGTANPTASVQTATFNNINVTGGFSLEIKQVASGLRIGVDDVSWTAYSGVACSAPSSQPSSLIVNNITNTSAQASFTPLNATEKYLVVRSTSSSLTNQPVNGTSYTEGDALGNGVIAYAGNTNSFVASDLQPGTTYYLFVYAYNETNCSGGPAYNTSAPLTGNFTTTTPPACATPTGTISSLQLSASATSVNGTFTAAPGTDAYLVIRNTSSSTGFTPVNGVDYAVGQAAGNGFVIKSGSGTSFVANGLSPTTTYYFFVYSMNGLNCTGGPLYNTSAVSGNITTTTSGTGDWPTGYYTYADGKSCAALKTALKQITDNTSSSFSGDNFIHDPQSYDNLWNQYKITDIKPREVGSGSANVIWDIYSDNPTGTDPYNYTPGTNQCGNYSGENSCYNREHSFPKSWFNDASPMYSDYHHLFPTDGYVNGKRSNYKYGEVASATWTSMNGSKLGSSSVAGVSGPVFEPINEYKGDVARAYLYMVTRYENLLPTWNGYSTEGAETFDGTVFPGVEVDYIRLMIKWHTQDPVSDKERNRNNGAYSFQGNRNPFVDHPEYVNEVWNSTCPGLSALPVDVIYFAGKLNGNMINLNWEVATEINLDRYEVERSFNGTSFAQIGSVKAENRNAYLYNDNVEQVRGRRIYYRLKKVDKDGKFAYSAVFTIHIPLNTKFSVYPNPANDFLKLQLNNNSNETAMIILSDITGKIVLKQNVQANQGLINISTSHLGTGHYIVKMITGNSEYSQRVLIINK